jgi:drug/metabolite transporter (DMT)-like permease
MPLGLLTGLGAALAWGTLDIFSALASRRLGSLRVTAGIQLVGATCVILLALASGTRIPTDPAVLLGGAVVGIAGAGAYLTYFTGLRIGPIAIVSGVVAAYGGLTVVLAVVIRHETLTTLQAAGATLATVGVILTGIAFGGGEGRARFASPGVVFAVVALVLFATMSIVSDIVIDLAGWLEVLLISRTTNVVLSVLILVVALTAARRLAEPLLIGSDGVDHELRDRDLGVVDRRAIGLIVLAGLLDIAGLIVFMYGLEHAETWLVGLASSFGPAVTMLVAVALLGDRLRPLQWLGVAGVLGGMVLIGLP